MTERELQQIEQEENLAKRQCLYALERALHYADRNCLLTFDEQHQQVICTWPKSQKIDIVNVRCDSTMAMIYDVLKQVPFYER